MKAASSALQIEAWSSSIESRSRKGIVSYSRIFFALKDRFADDAAAYRTAEKRHPSLRIVSRAFFPLPRRRGDFRLPFAACSQRRRVAIEEADVLLLTTVLRTKLGADTE